MPINFRLSSIEVLEIWKDSNPKCLIFQESFLDIYKELLEKKFLDKIKGIYINSCCNKSDCSSYYQIIQSKRDKLSLILDNLNTKYGKDTVTIGVVPEQSKKHHTGTKIAFGAVPTIQDFNE